MLLFLEIKRHILRTPARTLITACTAALLVCGMALYLRNIQVTQETLDELAVQMPVQVRITNRDVSSSTNLRIESDDFDALTAQNVRDVLCTSTFSFILKSVDARPAKDSMRVHAANAIAALNGPKPDSFTYLDGWDESFLQADEPVCAVESSFAKRNGLEPGSQVDAEIFSLYWGTLGMDMTSLNRHEFTVVAIYDDNSAQKGWNATVPIDWLRGVTDTTVSRYGDPIPFFYDSASAYISDLRDLNTFKYAMQEHGFRQTSPLPDRQTLGDALSIDDEMYIKASADLIDNLELYGFFTLPFFGLIILTVALITFLTLRSCRLDIAIASSLGRQKLLNAAAPFFSTVAVQAAGCLLALVIMSLATGLMPSFAGLILGSFMLCAMGGTALALCFLFRFDTLALLTKTD